jgi:quercetin dioxygenase-like cupin family protein
MKIYRLKETEKRELVPGGKVTFAHSDAMTLAFWSFREGSPLPAHRHPHEQILTVMEGSVEFTIDGETEHIDALAAIVIPPNALHSGMCLSDCLLIDAFHPKREDFVALEEQGR